MKVTIAIPFYNAEKYLELAIMSVIQQTYKDWILYLVNDGSTDKSVDIAKVYADSDPRIMVYSDGENKSLAFRLNQIAKLANTKYLARMDADDIMHPERIKKQVDILETNSKIDVLGTNAFSINENNMILGVKMKVDLDAYGLVDVKTFIHPTIMARTIWFRENCYDESAIRCEDAELWIRVNNQSTLKSYTEPLMFYREFGNGYYKKYFNSTIGLKYIAKKLFKTNKRAGIIYYFKGFVKHKLIGSLYLIMSLFNKESFLIRKQIYKFKYCTKQQREYLLFLQKTTKCQKWISQL
ncbi:MAG: glycosyltransferase family 2 protein [Paludibacter sp.]|jgi:glycosyltransferase involved in cell wall biosynthesis|nr:glycosyltransferase family 2 protein [Paludibacter sp.]